jgi:osmotically-inducible protein OsmY
VKATAADGVITLTGEADYRFEKNAAELNVSRLQGVTGISNEIALKPTTPTVPHFPADITKALARMDFDGANMTVTAEGGKVSLNGTVANAHQRELAEHAAWSAPGVTYVDDRLSIN